MQTETAYGTVDMRVKITGPNYRHPSTYRPMSEKDRAFLELVHDLPGLTVMDYAILHWGGKDMRRRNKYWYLPAGKIVRRLLMRNKIFIFETEFNGKRKLAPNGKID